MTDKLDLTGTWNGTYSYPGSAGPDTPFLARVEDRGGAISGGTMEPDILYGTGTIEAALLGNRSGRSVDFTKTYQGQAVGYQTPVDYVGMLSADGSTISGVWSLAKMDGTFEMHRDLEAEAPDEIEESVSVPQP